MLRLLVSMLFVLTTTANSFTAEPAQAKAKAEMGIAHMVYFKLKDSRAESKQKLIDGCNKYLSKHEGVIYFSAGLRGEEFARDVNDKDWDVGLHLVFANKAAHDKYQDHPDHTKFRDEIKDAIAKVRVFDTMVPVAMK